MSAKKKEEPFAESVALSTGDAHAVLEIDGQQFRLTPAQVALLRNDLNLAVVELF